MFGSFKPYRGQTPYYFDYWGSEALVAAVAAVVVVASVGGSAVLQALTCV